MLTRRGFLASSLAASGLGLYPVGIEPLLVTMVTRYRVAPQVWPAGLKLNVAVLADIHACEPWMTVERIEAIVHATNALNADVTVLLGDYVAGHKKITGIVPDQAWARALARLRAPLGVYAILGNHDWWADPVAQTLGHGPIAARKALESVGVPVFENDRIRLSKDGRSFWLVGLGDQLAFYGPRALSLGRSGVDDLTHALAGIPAEDPVILMVHEPDIFPQVPNRVAITLAGHTHGGQVRILGYAPLAPSPLSRRYLYGQFFEQGRRLIVSGGLGCSWWPVRFGAPPEIVLVEIGASDDAGRLAT